MNVSNHETRRGPALRRGARIRIAAAIALLAVAGCATSDPAAVAPAPAADEVRTHEGLHATLWLQTAAEYRANTLQAYRSATVHLDLALEDPAWTAALEQTGDYGALPPAIILDMDEAIIRSDRFQAALVKNDERFSIDAWNAWVRTETSLAIPGALAYVHHARERGVHVFYVTNRTFEVEQATYDTLRMLGFPIENGLDDLLTQDERPEWPAEKSSRRAFLARSHRVLQIVGDNLNDFTSGSHAPPAERRDLADRYADYWGSRWIILPNPAYGGWEGALYDFDHGLRRPEKVRRKLDFLKPWK